MYSQRAAARRRRARRWLVSLGAPFDSEDVSRALVAPVLRALPEREQDLVIAQLTAPRHHQTLSGRPI